MHRSGNHPDDRRPLGEALKDEVMSTLRLLFKNVEQHAVDVSMPDDLTVYQTDMPCDTVNVPLTQRAVEVSADPIGILHARTPAVSVIEAMTEARLADSLPCMFEPVMVEEPVLGEAAAQVAGVVLGQAAWSAEQLPGQHWPVEVIRVSTQGQTLDTANLKTAVSALATGSFRAKAQGMAEAKPQARVQHNPRFYALPIRKAPIPPHRFSEAAREKFRRALAEKAGTHPANVQLRIIFERMDMSLFAGIQQDEHGMLMCTPKSELLGKNQALARSQAPHGGSTYLVYGLRLDTQADVRALVPADVIAEEGRHD